MKKITLFCLFVAAVSFMVGCKSSDTREINGERYAKKIYLTKEDYMEDLKQTAQRRELQPNKESEYVFKVTPEVTQDHTVYFFDKRQQPKVPGEYSAQDYKNEKRLWKKPKRYSPEQYYGMQESAAPTNNGGEESYYE